MKSAPSDRPRPAIFVLGVVLVLAGSPASLQGQSAGRRVLSPATGTTSGRVALVIGNDAYLPAVGSLKNAVNDARAIAQVLREIGFDVTVKENLGRADTERAVTGFRRR